MRLSSRTRRLRHELGQSSVEYVGLSTVVVALLLAISHVDVGERLVAALGGQICSVLIAAPCSGSAEDIAAARLAALDPCPVRAAESGEAVNATVLSLRAASADRAVVEEHSDGAASVTFRDEEELGVEVGAGASAAARGGRGPVSAGLRAEAGAALGLAAGRTYEFRSVGRAAAFLRRHAGDETIGGEARNRALAACLGCRALGTEPRVLPKPDATYLEGGGSAHARADVGALGAGGAVEAFADGAVGQQVDHGSGQRTYYYRLGAEGSAGVAALLGIAKAEAAVTSENEGVIALEVAADGTPLELRAETKRATAGSLAATLAAGTLPGIGPDPDSGSTSERAAEGELLEYEAVLDLRNDLLSREAALRLVRALRPVTDPTELAESIEAVKGRIDAVGELNLRVFALGTSDAGVEGGGALAVRLGGGFERAESAASLTSAYTRPAGARAFVDRSDCLGLTT